MQPFALFVVIEFIQQLRDTHLVTTSSTPTSHHPPVLSAAPTTMAAAANALVTGAASGIGKALVQQLVSQGYTGLTVRAHLLAPSPCLHPATGHPPPQSLLFQYTAHAHPSAAELNV